MVNLSVSVDKIPHKNRYLVAKDIVYVSVTFDNDDKAREFVKKIFMRFKFQCKAVVIEDASNYANYFHESRLLEIGHNIIALDADCNDVMNVISNWCFYEISASIYFLADNVNCRTFPTEQKDYYRYSKKDIMDFLERNAIISIYQELDYTVNVCCQKKAFSPVWDILKKEEFTLENAGEGSVS